MKYIIILLLSIVSVDECRNDTVTQYSFYTAEYQVGSQVQEAKKECSAFFDLLKQVLFLADNGSVKLLVASHSFHSKHVALTRMGRKDISDTFFLQHVSSGAQEVSSFLSNKYMSGYYIVGLRKLII